MIHAQGRRLYQSMEAVGGFLFPKKKSRKTRLRIGELL